MRYIIWEEGDYFTTSSMRIDMDPQIVVILPDPMPIMTNFDFTTPSRGLVTDVRFENGSITGEVAFNDLDDKFVKDAGLMLAGFYNRITWDEKRTRVSGCQLAGVSLVHRDNVPSRRNSAVPKSTD